MNTATYTKKLQDYYWQKSNVSSSKHNKDGRIKLHGVKKL